MTSFHRDISGTFDGDQAKEFQGYDETICKRLEDASQKGWVLEGSPIALWDPKEGKIGAFQAISGHGDIPYGTFKPLGEVPPLVKTEQQSRYIRFVAG